MKNSKKWNKTSLACIIGFLVASSCNVSASESQLEEVLVTAQKTTKDIHDTTTSVEVVNSTQIDDFNLHSISDVIMHAPSVHYTESGISTQLRIRGIGSGNSQGFEQSVGEYVDGVYFARAQLFRAPLFDLDHIEVLRGSQNTLFGKDSIAGVFSAVTADATAQRFSTIQVGYTGETEERNLDGVLNGAITEDLNGRLAIHRVKSEGYMYNSTQDSYGPSHDDSAIRLKFDWKPSESFDLKLKLEHSSFDSTGRAIQIVQDIKSPLTLDLIAKQPGNATLKAIPSTYSNILSVLFKQPSFEANRDWQRETNEAEFSNNSLNNFLIDGTYKFSDTVEWHNKLSRLKYDSDELCDCEYVPAKVYSLALSEEYIQTSFDSYVSDKFANGNYLVGVYVQDSTHKFHDLFSVPGDGVFKMLGSPLAGTGASRYFSEDDLTSSIYGRVEINLTEKSSVTLEGRYANDKKDAQKTLTIVDASNQPIVSQSVTCAYLYGLKADTVQSAGVRYDCGTPTKNPALGVSPGMNLDQERSENIFSPSITFKHNFSDEFNAYASWKKGNKSGGFDPRSNSATSFEFSNETATTTEFGLRSLAFESRLENNLSIYSSVYKNTQISQFDGAVGFNVGNAREMTGKGIELNGRYKATHELSLSYGLSYDDLTYTDFDNGNCYFNQVPNGADINGDGIKDLCSYTGKRPPFAPPFIGNLGLTYDKDFGVFMWSNTLNYQYISSHNIHENLDPNGIQEGYGVVDFSSSLSVQEVKLSVIVKNMFNKYAETYLGNAPLSGSNFKTNTLYGFIKPPRTVSVQLEYKFQ